MNIFVRIKFTIERENEQFAIIQGRKKKQNYFFNKNMHPIDPLILKTIHFKLPSENVNPVSYNHKMSFKKKQQQKQRMSLKECHFFFRLVRM